MRINGDNTLVRWVRRMPYAFRSCAIVLAYHRVAELDSDPQLLSVTPQHFAEHLDVIHRTYRSIGLGELARSVVAGDITKGGVAVTFDDGYADNLHNARPLLEQYEVPGTVFVIVGCAGQPREFWWDELERILLLPKSLPRSSTLTVNGQPHRWDLSGEAIPTWDVTQPRRTARQKAYVGIYRLLRPLGDHTRSELMAQMSEWAGDSAEPRLTHLPLSLADLSALGQSPMVEIGSHTVSHPVLAAQSEEVQAREISDSKRTLEQMLGGRPVNTFSYPYGSKAHSGRRAIELVKNAGYTVAVANFAGAVTRTSNSFFLPRVQVRDWSGDIFARRLKEWLGR